MTNLPVISCDNCGACCRHMVFPPFVPDFFGADLRNEEFDRFKREHPDLAVQLRAEYERRAAAKDWPDVAPCFWYDATTGRCKHYEARPYICRDFKVGSESCLAHREGNGVV